MLQNIALCWYLFFIFKESENFPRTTMYKYIGKEKKRIFVNISLDMYHGPYNDWHALS